MITESMHPLQIATAELTNNGTSFSNNATSLSLPPEVFQTLEGSTESVGVAFSSYATPSLFPVREMDERFSIAPSVVGVIIHDMDTSALNKNVTITLPIQSVCTCT